METMTAHVREVVRSDNGDGSYSLSIEERGEETISKPGIVRRSLFFLAEKLTNILLPKISL